MAVVRLNKFLSQAGVASRREADRMILEGRVMVNRRVVQELGAKIDDSRDRVDADGRRVVKDEAFVYILLNKPAGYVVTAKDPLGRPTVMSLLPRMRTRVFPVGRLDAGSWGLLLLTNDGELSYRLTHPRFEIMKSYVVNVEGRPEPKSLRQIEQGIFLEGKKTAPSKIAVLSQGDRRTVLRIEIHEGRKREVRKMFEAVGHDVKKLTRTHFAGLSLGELKPGEWRHLRAEEILRLKRLAKLA